MADITTINGYKLKDAVSREDIAGIKNGTIKVGKASNADKADSALKDGDGNIIASTYIKTLPTASSTVKGGIKTGYAGSGNYRAVAMSGENAYVYIPTVTTSAAGLMSSADKTKLNTLYTAKIFKQVFFSTVGGDSDTKYFTMNAEFDQSAKTVRVTGTMRCVGGNSQAYRVISYSTLNSKLGCSGISSSTFKYGQWWADLKKDSTMDLIGYGSCFELNSMYLYFARHYQASISSIGAWGSGDFYAHCQNGQVFFDITFGYSSVS